MKTFFRVLFLPIYWFFRILSSGISLLTNLVFLGILLGIIAAVLYTPKVQVPDHSALMLTLAGDIVEERSPMDPVERLLGKVANITPLKEEIFLQDIIDTIYTAADDQRIKVLVINASRLGRVSLDQIKAIGLAIDYYKQAGKQVIAVADSFNQAQYYLASWANKIYLHPMGSVQLKGFGLYRLYMQEMLAKLNVDFHVFRVGTFKSALEPILRNDMSPEDKEASQLWLGNLWDTYCTDVAQHRHIEKEQLTNNIDNAIANLSSVNGNQARLAISEGLIDGIASHAEMEQHISKLLGQPKSAAGFKQISFKEYLQTVSRSYSSAAGEKQLVAIISASGNIMYGKGAVGQIGSSDLIEKIRKARQDSKIKALVLRISSGGGSALASELIRQELVEVQQAGKPVVISMGAMAASGAYWLSADADKIFAAPTTLTGSIGIFGAVPTLDRALADFGIHSDGIGTSKISHFGNLTSAMSPEEAQGYQLEVEQGYRRFLEVVANGRGMKPQEVEAIAEGRVWDGSTAKKIGLVDALGNLEDAVRAAAKLAHIPEDNGLFLDVKPESYLERLKSNVKPIEVLAGQFIHAPVLLHTLQRPLYSQFDFLLESTDPSGMYAHSMLPVTGVSLR